MNKNQWKQADKAKRRAVRRAVTQGIATDVLQGRGFAMLASIHEEIASQLAAVRQAEDYATNGSKSLLENNPECYGQSVGQQQRKYGTTYKVVTGGPDCDCELSEIESIVASAASHNHTEENIQSPLVTS